MGQKGWNYSRSFFYNSKVTEYLKSVNQIKELIDMQIIYWRIKQSSNMIVDHINYIRNGILESKKTKAALKHQNCCKQKKKQL